LITPHVESNEPASASIRRQRPGLRAAAALLLLGIGVTTLAFLAPGARHADAGIDRCSAPLSLTALNAPLAHTAKRLTEGKSLTIVALGSSSTYGTGASKPEYSYPSRLATLLQARYPEADIRVLNRGVGGEVAKGTMGRIANDVLADKPDLVVWQVGTNDVLSDADPQLLMAAVRAGIAQIKRGGADVILMDLQYAPAVLTHARYRDMEHALWATAKAAGVPLFHRFALMRDWAEQGHMKMATMVSADHLHMTDTSYDCLARQLSASILRNTHAQGDIRPPRG
jgi:lysophospholipase L1-like esterase